MPETLDQLLTQNEPISENQLTPEVISTLQKELQELPETERESKLRELLEKVHDDARDEITALKENIENPEV